MTSCKDLVQRPGEEDRNLVQRSHRNLEPLKFFRELLWRSLEDTLYRQVALQRDLAQQLLRRTCHEDLRHDLLQTFVTPSHRELAEFNKVSQYLFFMFLSALFWGLLPG